MDRISIDGLVESTLIVAERLFVSTLPATWIVCMSACLADHLDDIMHNLLTLELVHRS